MKTKLTLFIAVLAATLFMGGCASTEPAFVSDGLVAYYPFNGNAKDESGNGNDLEVKGAELTEDRKGSRESAYNFDGKGNTIEKSADTNLDLPSFSFSSWIKPDWEERGEVTFNPLIFGKREHDPNHALTTRYSIHINGGLNGYGFYANGYTTVSAPFTSAKWHHIVVAYGSEDLLLYLNGAVMGKIQNQYKDHKGFPILIGGEKGLGEYFKGSIDDIRIYNRTLSASEVKALYNLEKPKGK